MTNTPRTFKQWRADAVAILVLALALPLLWVLVQGQRISTSGHVTTGIVQNKEFSDGGSEGPDGYYLR